VPEMNLIADIIYDVISTGGEEGALCRVRKDVARLVGKFPLYKPLLKELKR